MSRPNKRHSEDYKTHTSGTKYRERSPSPKQGKTNDVKKQKPSSSPPPARKSGIQIKLNNAKTKTSVPIKPKMTVASVFNQDSDSEPEEMPPEARMRMRNIGRDTPTSAGPNSFGKTKHGFCDAKKVFEKHLKEAMNNVSQSDAD
ncbi:hypothetical protein CBL_14502 [Carabus blaptoides fortunei]